MVYSRLVVKQWYSQTSKPVLTSMSAYQWSHTLLGDWHCVHSCKKTLYPECHVLYEALERRERMLACMERATRKQVFIRFTQLQAHPAQVLWFHFPFYHFRQLSFSVIKNPTLDSSWSRPYIRKWRRKWSPSCTHDEIYLMEIFPDPFKQCWQLHLISKWTQYLHILESVSHHYAIISSSIWPLVPQEQKLIYSPLFLLFLA